MNAPARRPTGAVVNPDMPAPDPPGPWVDESACYVCCESYVDYRAGFTFEDAADLLRQVAKGAGDQGGGYRSRGPVLWTLRTMKLTAWYLEHADCGREAPDRD